MPSLVREIYTASKQQSFALGEINPAASKMDVSTQQNAAMVEETMAATHTLWREAQHLAALISRFAVEASHRKSKAKASYASPALNENPEPQLEDRMASQRTPILLG